MKISKIIIKKRLHKIPQNKISNFLYFQINHLSQDIQEQYEAKKKGTHTKNFH